MNIVERKLYSQKEPGKLALGQCNQALALDIITTKTIKTDKTMQIEISIGSIMESFDGKNKGLTYMDAVGATAGHEIEHTTEDNRDIGVLKATFPWIVGDKDMEKIPRKVGNKIREEALKNKFEYLTRKKIEYKKAIEKLYMEYKNNTPNGICKMFYGNGMLKMECDIGYETSFHVRIYDFDGTFIEEHIALKRKVIKSIYED